MPNPLQQAATLTRAAFGSVLRPVRTNANLLLNSPDGWVTSNGPVPWTAEVDGGPPVWWIGQAGEDGSSPIGPHGPNLPPSVAAMERAVGLIVGPLTHVWPWRVYRGMWMGADAEPLPVPTWLRDPTLINRTPGVTTAQQHFLPHTWKMPGPRFWAQVLRHALLHGRGWYMHQESDVEGAPVAGTFLVVSPAAVAVDPDTGAATIDMGGSGQVTTDRLGRFSLDGSTWRLQMLPEPLGDGTGVIGRHADLLGVAVKVGRYTSNTFAAGVPSGYLKVTAPGLTQVQAQALKQAWMSAHGSSRGIAVLNATTDFTPITYSPVDAALTEVDHMLTRKIAHAFNLSGWALDAGSTGNDYANITDRRQDKVDDTLMPWKRAVEESLSAALLSYGTWLELETRGYLATDPAKRMTYFEAGVGMGLFDVEYAQDLERIPTGYRPPEAPPQPEPPAVEPPTEEGSSDEAQ